MLMRTYYSACSVITLHSLLMQARHFAINYLCLYPYTTVCVQIFEVCKFENVTNPARNFIFEDHQALEIYGFHAHS